MLFRSLSVERIAAETGFTLTPFVILQTERSDEALVRDWPRPDAGINTHLAYALQWYAMAALAAAAWFFMNIKKRTD